MTIKFKHGLGLISLVAFLLASMPAHALLDGKFKKELEKEAGAVKLVRELQRGGYDVVTTAELKAWMDEKKDMVVVDTMPYEASYKKAHVPGAVQFLFPIPDMNTWDKAETDGKSEADFEALLGPDKDKVIVIYCGFVKCTRSHNGAVWAKKLGYKNVYRFAGGIYAWKGADYEIEKE
jgi:thiosulfate/3-mercaptopyruvate sulfurtransferase